MKTKDELLAEYQAWLDSPRVPASNIFPTNRDGWEATDIGLGWMAWQAAHLKVMDETRLREAIKRGLAAYAIEDGTTQAFDSAVESVLRSVTGESDGTGIDIPER